MRDINAIEQEVLKSIILNPRSKPHERLEALKRLDEAEQRSECPICSGRLSPDKVESYWNDGVGDALEGILNRDPDALTEFPETASLLLEPIERLERLEEAASLAESERWCAPSVREQREREKLAREAELQREADARRRGRGSAEPPE
jgi:hypothetical protein